MLKSMSFRTTLVAIACAIYMSAHAMADTPKKVDIPAGDLRQALLQLSKQYGADLVYRPEQVTGLKTHGAHGELTTKQAVSLLLEGTPLELRTDPSGAMLIAPAHTLSLKQGEGSGDPPDGPNSSKSSSGDGLRLAQANQGQTSSPSTVETPQEKSEKREDLQEVNVHIPEILVTGSRLLDMDIRRTPDDPQPYVVFDRQQITQSGAASLEDFLKYRLTMNAVAGTNAQTDLGGFSGNQSQINLRGLGTNQTLILIDGHRTASVNALGTPQQFDINGIPLAAVERIEVLPTTASAIYGGSATGGAVNIILRRDYTGAELRLTYDSPFDTSAGLRTINLSGGFNLEDGKTNVLIAGTYSDSSALTVGDRDFLQRGRAAILAHNGNNYQVFSAGSGSPPLGATPNILSADGSNLVLNNGTSLNSPITYVPVGYAGTSDGGAALVANAGKYNLNLANSAQSGGGSLSPLVKTPKLESFMATLRRQFSPRVQAFLEVSASSNAGDYDTGVAVGNSSPFLLSAGAPHNPFQQAILLSVPTNSDTQTVSSSDVNHRLMGGLIVQLPGKWLSEADYTWDQSRYSFRTGPLSLTSAAASAVTAGTLNILRDTNAYPVNFSPYLDPGSSQSSSLPFRTALKDASLRFAGPLGIVLPAGTPQVTTLLERRDENLEDAIYNIGNFGTSSTFMEFFPGRSQSTNSLYAELRVPLVSKKNAVHAIQELELQISGRHDDYTTHGITGALCCDANTIATSPIVRTRNKIRSTDPLVALRYQPLQDVALRASYGTGFLPPRVDQIVPNPVDYSQPCNGIGYPDPRRGDTLATFPCVSGGNPNLQPEQSKSWSTGVVLTPRVLPGLRLSVDYTNIHKTDNIADITGDIATLEALGRVTRGPNLPGDQPGWAGPITSVDQTLVNLLKAEVQAYDVQLDYRWNTTGAGVFDFFALATWETHYKTQGAARSPLVENVGVGDFNPLKFKANAGATWAHRRWILGWSARHFDSYWVNAAHTFDVNQGSDHIPRQTYHDVFATYRFDAEIAPRSWSGHSLSGTEITLGVKNVFNKEPPFDATNRAFSYSNFGDPRLASYWLSVKKTFTNR